MTGFLPEQAPRKVGRGLRRWGFKAPPPQRIDEAVPRRRPEASSGHKTFKHFELRRRRRRHREANAKLTVLAQALFPFYVVVFLPGAPRGGEAVLPPSVSVGPPLKPGLPVDAAVAAMCYN